MRLDIALKKIGVEVVSATPADRKLTLLLRIHQDAAGLSKRRWADAAASLVRKAHQISTATGTWDADVSKVLVESQGTVVFLWRVILTGEVQKAQHSFGQAVLDALHIGAEVESMPLIGQVVYPHDPAKGKLKGGHDLNSAASLIAGHFLP